MKPMQGRLTIIGVTNFLDVSSLRFSFLQMLMLQQLKMRHLKKIRETNGGKNMEQDIPLTHDSPQVWPIMLNKLLIPENSIH